MKKFGRLIIIFLFIFLVACNASSEKTKSESEPDNSGEQTNVVGQDDENTGNEEDEEVEPDSDEEKTTEYENCESILFSTNNEIDGTTLADCVVEAMVMQQTGTHIVKDESGIQTTVDFKWDPHFSLSIDNSEFAVILKEDTGWMQTLDGRWIQEDPNSSHPETKLANTIIQGYRTFADPRFIGQMLGMVSTWKVVDELPVPDSEAFVDVAWKLTSVDVVDMEISVISDFEFWITSDYLGAYFAATGTMGNINSRSSNTFTQWGEPVDIPTPE